MKVLILSTFATTGGGAIAAGRLVSALKKRGAEVTLMSRRNITWGPQALRKQSWSSVWERFVIWMHNGLSMKGLWSVDIANCGQDITETGEFREADVVHLHWVNQGFISLDTLEKIVKSGKRVVWTMHDEWPLDGIYHYTDGSQDVEAKLNQKVIARKKSIYSQGRITFVACSQWLRDIASKKPLGVGQEVIAIPNPIDTQLFSEMDEKLQRRHFKLPENQKLVLFCCQKVTDKRKGLDYLIEAAKELTDVAIVLVGGRTEDTMSLMPENVPVYSVGAVRDVVSMARLYNACDCFVTPSLQDNLPNTIMEAMSCGVPCVGFNVGGIPEMIDHGRNGYVAKYKDAKDLARGIRYVLDDKHHERLTVAARLKVLMEYSEPMVAFKYMKVYAQT